LAGSSGDDVGDGDVDRAAVGGGDAEQFGEVSAVVARIA
jgi:hypothetical protein